MKPRSRSSAAGRSVYQKILLIFACVSCLGIVSVSSLAVESYIPHLQKEEMVNELLDSNNSDNSNGKNSSIDRMSTEVSNRISSALEWFDDSMDEEISGALDSAPKFTKPFQSSILGTSISSDKLKLSNYNTKVDDDIKSKKMSKRENSIMIPEIRYGRSDYLISAPRLGRSNYSIPNSRFKSLDSSITESRFKRSNYLIPFPRFGRSDALIPLPRAGRSDYLIPVPRVGRSDFLIPAPRFERSNYLIPVPRVGRSNYLIPVPRYGRSNYLIPVPRVGRSNYITLIQDRNKIEDILSSFTEVDNIKEKDSEGYKVFNFSTKRNSDDPAYHTYDLRDREYSATMAG
ncbi:hypothetical protein TNIN_43281 [Trichonephila inaurata madagascariensis]|uniref:Uncharacterized protein n=1 Tax=Trichonephila inaurata madagascariensis TaxID=2747483 RepID=A0A8X6J2T1_9ARAC|nr:hypothetical protein TNIN_43281 [Trichonephila inaurata madagascariensis]